MGVMTQPGLGPGGVYMNQSMVMQPAAAVGSMQFVQQGSMDGSAVGAGMLGSPVGTMGGMPSGPLKVSVLAAHGLRDADWLPMGGKSDPYAVVEVEGKPHTRFQTDVINSTTDPVWNIQGDIPDYEPGDRLSIAVYDKDPLKGDDLLGRVVLSSQDFANGLSGDVALADAGKGQHASITLNIEPPVAPLATIGAMPSAVGTIAMPIGTMGGVPLVGGTMPMGGLPMQGGMLKAGSITDDVFNMVDRNQDGVISRSEFRGALKGNVISASQTTH